MLLSADKLLFFFLSYHWFLLFLIKIFLHFWGLLLLSFCLLLKLVDVQSFFFWHVIIQRYKFLKAFFAVLHQFWSSNTLATWCKQLTQWKSPWCWERLKAKGQEGSRGWDGWMASPTQWIRVWANSRNGEGQGRLACCCPRGCKESDMTERMNNHHQFFYLVFSLSWISTYF